MQIAPYVVQFSWGSPKLNQSDRIYYTAYASKKGDQGKLSQWSAEAPKCIGGNHVSKAL